MTLATTARILLPALLVTACTPALNWREIRPDGSELMALFPCKPDRMTRHLALAGVRTQMQLLSCDAGGVTYAVTHAAVEQPAQVDPALKALHQAAAANVGGSPHRSSPLAVPGMNPHPLAQRLTLSGRHADGAAVQMQAAFFVRGLRVVQATVVGPRLDGEAADNFFAGLRLPA